MSNNQVNTLSIKELCNNKKYIIPIYQRNYAWGQDEIDLLIQDILDALEKNKKKNYYIGSLVVSKRKEGYEVIDGQQRLTTLKLLLSYYNKLYDKSEEINLDFEHREQSNLSLEKLSLDNSYQENSIEQGFEIIKAYKNKLSEEFFTFLLNNVIILRTEVPKYTDLNHYFEIMNNRGEQLEHHEVLKARLMSYLDEKNNERKLFSLIWDSCSDMNVYVIKRFPYSNDDSKNIRTNDAFFGADCQKIPSDFNKMLKSGFNIGTGQDNTDDIFSLLNKNKDNNNNKDDDNVKDGDFNSIIDFPNFLMIVLKIFYEEKNNDNDNGIPLNDKFLLEQFNSYLVGQKGDALIKEEIKEFIVRLLQCRLIFDRYILKSREQEDSWLLNGVKRYQNNFTEVNTFGKAFESKTEKGSVEEDNDELTDEHTKIVQLLSMFHTAFRQKIYKEWLYDVLKYLCKDNSLKEYTLEPNVYISFLENLANEYYKKRRNLIKQGGTSIPHFIFNYLDYLLWRDWEKLENREKVERFISKEKFIFSLSRNSVEHFLPRSKKDELLKDIPEKRRDKRLNNLGNLCLISHYQNSSLNNLDPKEKMRKYESQDLKCISLKQALMLSYSKWGAEEIREHRKKMRQILEGESISHK